MSPSRARDASSRAAWTSALLAGCSLGWLVTGVVGASPSAATPAPRCHVVPSRPGPGASMPASASVRPADSLTATEVVVVTIPRVVCTPAAASGDRSTTAGAAASTGTTAGQAHGTWTGRLPFTGEDLAGLLALGAGLVTVGVAVARGARRPTTR